MQMLVYFVRHGESEFNATKSFQHGHVPLSKLGIEQAKFVAKRFNKIQIDLILASTYTRADQTAREISKLKKMPIEYSDLFIERKRPSSFAGKPYADPKLKKLIEKLDNNPDPNHHHEDEENFFDFIKRVEKILNTLKNRSEENIALVSHGFVIHCLIGLIMHGDRLTQQLLFDIQWKIKLHNTGITLVEFTPDLGWRLLTINDIAHLGDNS